MCRGARAASEEGPGSGDPGDRVKEVWLQVLGLRFQYVDVLYIASSPCDFCSDG